MKTLKLFAGTMIVSLLVPVAFADTWLQGNITEIRTVANGNSGDSVIFFGNFATGCTTNGVLLFSTDPYFKETYAMLLAAKASGAPVKILHSFCSGQYSRSNGYAMVE